jgi:hypothetical protein
MKIESLNEVLDMFCKFAAEGEGALLIPDIVPGASDEANSAANRLFNSISVLVAKSAVDSILMNAYKASKAKGSFYPTDINVSFQAAMAETGGKPDPKTAGIQQMYCTGSQDVTNWVVGAIRAKWADLNSTLVRAITPKLQDLAVADKNGYEGGKPSGPEKVFVSQRTTVTKKFE